jgi:hypothetical protein
MEDGICHHLAEGVILGEEAADGLAVDLARGEVDQTLAVLRAVLDLQTGHEHVTLRHSQPGEYLRGLVGE